VHTQNRLRPLSLAVGLSLAATSFQAGAAGYAIIEHSATGLGNAFAGAAAVAEDASTIYFNPAGMTYLPGSQMVVAGHIIMPKAEFNDRGSYLNPDLTGGTAVAGSLRGDDADGGVTKFVPNFYFSYQLDDRLFAGIGINAPFGLATEYDEDWVGRYHALDSDITTVNINPSLAWKVNERLSIGAGISVQYIEATLSNTLDFGTICMGMASNPALPRPPFPTVAQCTAAGATPQNADGRVKVEGSDWSWGFNLGAILQLTDNTRLGLAYRSKVSHDLEGRAEFRVPANFQTLLNAGIPLFTDTDAMAAVDLPESASFSFVHDFNPQWTVLADVTWTRWSRFDELVIEFDNPNQADSVQPENWEDSWRYSIGAIYRPNGTWTFRAGLAYDETPIDEDTDRTPRIPGNDRTWIALGVGYRISDTMAVDVGYAHLFVDDTKIDALDHTTGHQLVGEYDSAVDIVSAQLTVDF